MTTPSPSDPLAAELAAWRALADAATDGPWEPVTDNHGRKGIEHAVWASAADRYAAEFMFWQPDAAFTAAARSAMPRLLAAAADVLKLHAGDVNEDYPHETPLCGEWGEWVPCTTTKTITRVLTGEDPQ